MNARTLRSILCLIVTLTMSAPVAWAASPGKHPNVLVIVVDDLGWRDLGFTGSTFYESPNLDALAAKGMVFSNAYAACPVCSPTRAALMTGRYPARVGITDYIGGPQPSRAATQPRYRDRMLPASYKEHLELDEFTVGEAFKQAGYATFFAGKWHLGREPYYPDKQGFETTVGASFRGSPAPAGYFAPYSVPVPPPTPAGEHLDLRLAREAANWIKQQKPAEKPFLLWMSFYDVHIPLQAPAETVRYFEDKRAKLNLTDEFGADGKSKLRLNQSHAIYAAMIKTMDTAVGTIVKQLEEQKLLDDTIILFTSDNGGVATSEGWPTSNLPLRAGKGWAYEGGVRVPMFVIDPRVTKPGTRSDEPTISTDVFPTLLAACGLAPHPDKHVDGISILPALNGEKLPGRPLFWHYPHYGNQGGAPFSSIRSGNWKLIEFHDPRQGVELYDLAQDPTESRNLAADDPSRAKELQSMLESWKKSVGAKDATPADAEREPGESRIILAPSDEYPRYSEADAIELTDGRLLLAVARKKGASDFALGTIIGMFSPDGGKTWDAEPHVIQAPFADRVDLMSVSLFRTKRGVHLLFLARSEQAKSDTLVYQILSTDEGKTWGEPTRVSVRPGYHVVNNARVIRTSTGRLLVPASYVERIDTGIKGRSVIVLLSDDDGVTWRESKPLELKDVALMEPGVAQCADGSIYMTIRTALGTLYEARSRDNGETWGDLGPTKLPAPAAPSTVVRAPDSDELWLFWCNNAKANWKQRTPQVFARSKDNGKTWSEPREIESDPNHSYGYISFTRVKDDAVLTYYDWEDKGQPSFKMTGLRQRVIPLEWFRK